MGRVLSGFSAGLMTGTATAALTDMLGPAKPRRASIVSTVVNTGGLGLGPLLAGLFAQYLPRPTVLVFEVYLALLAAAALAVAWVPETVPQRQRLSIRFAGFGFPPSGRDEFLAAGVAGFAAFSLLGIFSALAPTFLGGVLHQHSHAVAGAVVFMIFAISAATQVVAGHFDYRKVVSFGLALFLLVLALIVAGLSQASLGLFLAGTGVGGSRSAAFSWAVSRPPTAWPRPSEGDRWSPLISCSAIWALRSRSSQLVSARSTSASSGRSSSARSRSPFCLSSHWPRSEGAG